jgi:quinol monooxygenase YgiN
MVPAVAALTGSSTRPAASVLLGQAGATQASGGRRRLWQECHHERRSTMDKGILAADIGKKLIGAKLSIKPEKVGDFVATARTVIAASRAEPGCISYTLYQDPYERTVFFFFEEWKDQAAIDAHFATPHFNAFVSKLEDMAAGPAGITIYSCPSEKKP